MQPIGSRPAARLTIPGQPISSSFVLNVNGFVRADNSPAFQRTKVTAYIGTLPRGGFFGQEADGQRNGIVSANDPLHPSLDLAVARPKAWRGPWAPMPARPPRPGYRPASARTFADGLPVMAEGIQEATSCMPNDGVRTRPAKLEESVRLTSKVSAGGSCRAAFAGNAAAISPAQRCAPPAAAR